MQSLRITDIVKLYGEHAALNGACFEALEGQVVAICGENGAGKSTLMGILSGSRQPTKGRIEIDNQVVKIPTPHVGFDFGIRTVYQELSLLPKLSVTENLYLGDLPTKKFGQIDWKKAHRTAEKQMQEIGMLDIDVKKNVDQYSVATQQMIEIAKALAHKPEVLILDEPTGVLTEFESQLLFKKIDQLKSNGTIILYISHRLEEVLELADKIVVLKDGVTVDEMTRSEASNKRLVKSMVGRSLEEIYPQLGIPKNEIALKVSDLTLAGQFKDISFDIKAGEIHGFFGLIGSGRSEVARCIFAADPYDNGMIELQGETFRPKTPAQAIKAGIGLITEERKKDGLLLAADILDNAGLASMHQTEVSMGPLLNRNKQYAVVYEKSKELDVRPLQLSQKLRHMSGGNQQKVILAKWMLVDNLKILILDEPTRGVDIATKVEIYKLIANLAKEGMAIMLISSEMPELLGLSNRISVFKKGALQQTFSHEEANEKELFNAAAHVELKVA